MAETKSKLEQLRHALIVSCQAAEGEPLCAPEHIVALSLSALNGGAAGLRLEGEENIRAVRAKTSVPLVGLIKSASVTDKERLHKVYITASLNEALAVAQAGADFVALDATARPRPGGHSLQEIIKAVHEQTGKLIWADVSTFQEGIQSAEAGADVISTTLSGYTSDTACSPDSGPDFVLMEQLCEHLKLPVVLEGKVWHPDEVARAFALGAYAVVVGSAITRPQLITRRFVRAIP